jgi:hypothetical protein
MKGQWLCNSGMPLWLFLGEDDHLKNGLRKNSTERSMTNAA